MERDLHELSDVFRIHGLYKMNMHGLLYTHNVFSFLANSYTPKQAMFLSSLVYFSIHAPCFVCNIAAWSLSKNIELHA